MMTFVIEVNAEEAPPKPKEQLKSTPWNQEQLQLLVKGVNLYPPGTADRFANCTSPLTSSYMFTLHCHKGGTPLPTTLIHMYSLTTRQQQW